MKKFLVLAVIAVASILESQASTVGWSSQNTNSLGLSDGNLALQGSLVRLGYFTVSNSAVQSLAAAGDKAGLDSAFQQFGTSTVGANFGVDGVWSDSAVNGNASFVGNRIYYWTLNAATLAAATQWGIFTNPVGANVNSANWVFPSDSPLPGNTVTDLGDVPHNSTGLIVGSFGGGPDANFGAPLYEMANISGASPVPEPSTFAFGALACVVGLCSVMRRRRQQRA